MSVSLGVLTQIAALVGLWPALPYNVTAFSLRFLKWLQLTDLGLTQRVAPGRLIAH
ncbi:MAG: hypothetical protein K2Q25_07230 [Mycobacteriaceae bacterium]|nr:hypothetical protein [Mycobacteriaceae bacterium]